MDSYLVPTLTLLIALGVLEAASHRMHFRPALVRKAVHVGMAALIIFFSLLFDYSIFIWLGIAFGILMLILRFTKPLKSLSDRHKQSYGEVFFPFGVTAAALFSHSTANFIAVISILGLADTAAYFIGGAVKSPKLLFSKTLAGSIVCATVTFLIALFVVQPVFAALVGLAVACIEAVSPRGSDNLTIPIVSAALIAFA